MENVDIFTCPTASLAGGIEVLSGGRLEMQNCTVADCRIAVDAKPASFIALEGTKFTNNYIGVNLNMSGASAPFQRLSSLVLANNVFETANGGALKPPYPGMPEVVGTRSFAGIVLNDYMDFNVWARNDFARLNNGLVAFNSTMNIGNFHFNDMRSADVPNVYSTTDGHGILLNADNNTSWANINEPWLPAMTFNNCKTAISAGKYAGRVENCYMTNVDAGITWWISRNRDVRILNNTISAQLNGIVSAFNEPLLSFGNKISQMDNNTVNLLGAFPGNGADSRQGIYLLELGHDNPEGGWLVTDNTIALNRGGKGIEYLNGNFGALQANTINNADPSFPYSGIETRGVGFSAIALNDITQTLTTGNAETFGIYSEGGYANRYDCNCLDNTGVGMQFYDMGDFTDGVRGNKFNTHNTTGLRLGIQGLDAFIGTQNHTGNEWDLGAIPSGQNGGENWGADQDVVDASAFTVDPNEKGGALNPPVFPSSGWFNEDVTAEPSYNCSNQCAAPNLERPPFVTESAVPTTLDQAIINGTFTTTSFEAPMEWKAAYRVYRKMLRQPALVQSSAAATAFKLRHDTLSTGALAWVAEERAGLFALTHEQDSLLGIYAADVDTVSAQLLDLDEQIQEGDSVSQTTYNALVTQRGTTQAQLEQFWAGVKQTRDQQIQNLLNYNSGISTSLTIDGNHKSMNDIVLRFFATDTLATGDLTTLETIAAQCPLEGGDAVYEARAMVSYFTGVQFDNSACIGGGERSDKTTQEESREKQVSIYPNPSTGLVNVTGVESGSMIRIIDQLGRVAQESVLTGNQLNVQNLQSGLYHLQVLTSEGNVVLVEKLMVSKK